MSLVILSAAKREEHRSRKMKLVWPVVCVALALGCGKHGAGATALTRVKAATTPVVVIGNNPDTSGNIFWHGVSDDFDEPELRRLYDELNGPRVAAKLRQYECPDTLPPFTITVVLLREQDYQERGVRMQMTPPLYKKDGRIEGGIGYWFEQTVHSLDKGKPIDYGYRSPLDGSPRTPPVHTDSYQEPVAGPCK
jgi:hypothetical protein